MTYKSMRAVQRTVTLPTGHRNLHVSIINARQRPQMPASISDAVFCVELSATTATSGIAAETLWWTAVNGDRSLGQIEPRRHGRGSRAGTFPRAARHGDRAPRSATFGSPRHTARWNQVRSSSRTRYLDGRQPVVVRTNRKPQAATSWCPSVSAPQSGNRSHVDGLAAQFSSATLSQLNAEAQGAAIWRLSAPRQ